MGQYLVRRLSVAMILVLAAATLIFLMLHMVPGDPVLAVAGEYASEEQLDAMRHTLGLDRPLFIQYLSWLGDAARGDFGTSITLKVPVSELLLQRVPRTIELATLSIILSLLIGLPAGVTSALHRGKTADMSLTLTSLVTLSIPTYVSGTLLVLIFAVQLKWLPASGFTNFTEDPVHHLKLLVLPCITLASHLTATVIRFTRSAVLEVLHQDYVRTARGKGLDEPIVIIRHVLRNSLPSISTVVGLQAGFLFGGTVIVEVIFGWPGIGTLLFEGINALDYPIVQACVLIISMMFILINLFVDIFNGMVDPRVAHGVPE